MANTYNLIASNTLTSAQSTVTFSSIPQTYMDLLLKVTLRHDGIGGSVYYGTLTFNSDNGNNYSDVYLFGTGAAAISSYVNGVTPTNTNPLAMVISSYTANTFSNSEIYIPNYKSATSKPMLAFSTTENNGAGAAYLQNVALLWQNASAISSIDIKPQGGLGSFVTDSSFYLYGISNS